MAAPAIGTGDPQLRTPEHAPGPPDVPRREGGTELIGAYQGSGYVEGKYLVGRADGQMIQLPYLLYRLTELLDGERDTAALAAALGADLERGVTAEQVAFLVDERLRPVGIAAPAAGAPVHDGPGPVGGVRPDPFLALRYRAPLCSSDVTWVIAGIFAFLYRPPVLLLGLGAFLALDVWLVVAGGLGQVVPAATALIYQPSLTLAVLATMLLCFTFHEFGHASACRYGGARPGSMGVGLYLIWPAIYTTVTDAYRLSRAGRLRTDLGGVYFNALFLGGLSALYLATGEPWLLVAIVVLHVETVTQFLPTVRFDGYYILSDLIGLPDLFMYLVPVLRGAIPGRTPDPQVTQLRPWVRRVITFWVLAVIPCLLLMLAVFVAVAPHTLPVLFAVIGDLIGAVGDAVRAGQTATATLGVLQLVFVVLPWIGSALILWMLSSQVRDAVATRRRRLAAARREDADPAAATGAPEVGSRSEAEDRRARAGDPVGWFLAAMVPVLVLTAAGVAALGPRVTAAGESLVAAATGTAAGTPVAVPGVPAATAFGVRQLAALTTLLDGLGRTGFTDGLRAVLLVAAAAGAAAVWAVARRFGLSAPSAAAATLLAAVPAPALALHATVDPAVLGAVWLTIGVALFGQRPARTGVALVALLAGALTVPPAFVAIAAFGVHRLLAGSAAGGRRTRLACAALVAAAGALAAATLLSPDGPFRVAGGDPVPPSVLVPVLVVGLVGAGASWYRRAGTAPLGTAVVVLVVWAVAVPASANTLLLVAVPAVAVLAAGTLDLVLPRIRRAQGQIAVTALVAIGLATSWPTVLTAFGPPPQRDALAGWVRDELGRATVAADPLTTVELVRAGIDPGRVVPPDRAATDTLVAWTRRPGAGTGAIPGDVVFTAPHGPDGAPVMVLRPSPAPVLAPTPPGPDAAAPPALGRGPRAVRADLGGQLVADPRVLLEGDAADRLRVGDIDERLTTVLSELAGMRRLTVAGFVRVPGEPDTVPVRTAVVTAIDGLPVADDEVIGAIVGRLDGQPSRYRPDRVQVDRGVLVLHFPVDAPVRTP